jgi:hypothetical protein
VKYSITVTNGGEYCQDGAGVVIGMSDSEIGVTYSLLRNGTLTGDTEPGDGNAISFGTFTQTGTYTATAVNASTCAATMNGSVTVKINPKPAAAQEFTGSRLVCPDTEIIYTVPEIEGAISYIWSFPAGTTIVSGLDTRTIIVELPGRDRNG